MYQLNGSLPVPVPTTTSAAFRPTTPASGPSALPSAGNYSYIGCYADSTASRALIGLINPVLGASLTVESCVAACKDFEYAGVEYSAECYCGNTLLGGSALASGGSDPTQNMCSMTCNGNVNEYCGGPNRLSIYQFNSSLSSVYSSASSTRNASTIATIFSSGGGGSAVTPMSQTSTANATTTNTTSTPSPTGPITVQNSTAFNHLGCYSGDVQARALTSLANPGDGTKNSVEACSLGCAEYTYFGVEYSAEYYCGITISAGSSLVAGSSPDATQCNMICSGNRRSTAAAPIG